MASLDDDNESTGESTRVTGTYRVQPSISSGYEAAPRANGPDVAIRAAVRELMRGWTEAGYWRDACDAGPGVTGVVTVCLHFMKQLGDLGPGITRYLVNCQLPDGSFPSYPGGQEGEVSATAACYAALVVTGKAKDRATRDMAKAAADQAKAFLEANGGVDAVVAMARGGDLGALTLAMAGELSPDRLPDAPVLFGLAPGAEYLLAKRFALLVPFRALISEVLTAHLRAHGAQGTPPRRGPRLGPLPRSGRELSTRLVSSLDAAAQRATTKATDVTRSGADLVSGLMKDTARTAMGVAQGTLTAAAGAADSLRQGPMRFVEGLFRGAIETSSAVARGAVGALSTFERLTPDVLAGGQRVVREVEGLRCQAYLHKYRNADGSWLYGDAVHTALALAALYALGIPASDQAVVESLTWLRRSPMLAEGKVEGGDRVPPRWFNVFYTDVWPTAFSLRALLNAGADVSDPVISRAANWLMASQQRGSWAFQAANLSTPDIDDTAVALAALALVRDQLALLAPAADGSLRQRERDFLRSRCETSAEAARIWLLAQQNADGGWAAYQPGLPGKPPGPIMTRTPAPPQEGTRAAVRFFLNPPAELGDPATEDVTGRVLYALGLEGVTASDRAVQNAIQFLETQQDTSGGWWGRWVVNFVASTAWVLRGLAAVRADLRTPSVRKAIDFLVAHQRADGGWSESVETYRDPDQARNHVDETGDGNPCLTGLVVSALVEVGIRSSDPSVARGKDYLVDYQRRYPRWLQPDEETNTEQQLHSLFPPTLFYTLPQTSYQLPLEGLGLYRRAARQENAPAVVDVDDVLPPERPKLPVLEGELSDTAIEEMRRVGDPDADEVIAELFQSEQSIDGINRIFRGLASLADTARPLPQDGFSKAAAERVSAFLNKIERPKPEDRLSDDDLKLAQDLFAKTGFGVPLALFCSSLPQCYAFPEGARILMASGTFTADPRRRLVETAQLVFDVASGDGMRLATPEQIADAVQNGRVPPGRGIRTAQKVRLMHAAIRHLAKDPRAEVWPVPHPLKHEPISQLEMVGTMLSFSVLVTDGLRAMGFPVTDEEANAWFKLWRSVGRVLGIQERKDLPDSAADGARLFDRLRVGWESSPQGTELARDTLNVMREYLPGEQFDGVVDTLVRHLAGDRCADLLEVGPSDWTKVLVEGSPVLNTMMGQVLGGVFFESALTPLLQRSAFTTMEKLSQEQRQGKNVTFAIPTELRNAWRHKFQKSFRPR